MTSTLSRRKQRVPFVGLCVMPLLAMLVGCASPWEKNFRPNPALEGRKFAPTASVQVRTVEFERLRRYSEHEKQIRIQSTTAPEDLSAQERLASKNRLLEALQMKERGDEIEVLGWSEFVSTDLLDPHSEALAQFAKKIGADYVVVATEYAGRVSRIEEQPMTTYSHSYATVLRGRGRRPYTVSQSDSSTTWVPMHVTEDQYFYTAAFLRRTRPGEAAED